MGGDCLSETRRKASKPALNGAGQAWRQPAMLEDHPSSIPTSFWVDSVLLNLKSITHMDSPETSDTKSVIARTNGRCLPKGKKFLNQHIREGTG